MLVTLGGMGTIAAIVLIVVFLVLIVVFLVGIVVMLNLIAIWVRARIRRKFEG